MKPIEIKTFRRDLKFIKPAKTSRDTLFTKPSWFICIFSKDDEKMGWGECSIIPGLSLETETSIEKELIKLSTIRSKSELKNHPLSHLPALNFAIETALLSLQASDPFTLFDTPFSRKTQGIAINGLVWMAPHSEVIAQMHALSNEGFRILKMKVGAGDFEDELDLLRAIRAEFPAKKFELRLDANGAFAPEKALHKLEQLAKFDIHSIEQPIRAKQDAALRTICGESPIPVALDEELIGRTPDLDWFASTGAHYLILKPSLIGGLAVSAAWADIARVCGKAWWATSALESNIGLNAIAQWCAQSGNELPQGLGTGRLFENNISSPLEVQNAQLILNHQNWDLSTFDAHER